MDWNTSGHRYLIPSLSPDGAVLVWNPTSHLELSWRWSGARGREKELLRLVLQGLVGISVALLSDWGMCHPRENGKQMVEGVTVGGKPN